MHQFFVSYTVATSGRVSARIEVPVVDTAETVGGIEMIGRAVSLRKTT